MTDPILYETLPSGIARIVLNRAETRNAQDTALCPQRRLRPRRA
jgi:enoyl-CoA hydratase